MMGKHRTACAVSFGMTAGTALWSLLPFAVLPCPSAARADVTLIARAVIAAEQDDLSGLTAPMATFTQARLGGFGSAIDYDSRSGRFFMLPDRGPGDGGSAYLTRYHLFQIDLPKEPWVASAPASLSPRLLATNVFHDADGKHYPGNSGAYSITPADTGRRYDPEGIRVGPDGTVYISDEYGPWIDAFSPDGTHLRRLPVPQKFSIANPDGDGDRELPPRNLSGRQANRGLEGLAISPDGRSLFSILQSPLIQDGALNAKNKRIGRNIRVLELPAGAPTETDAGSHATSAESVSQRSPREYVYVLDDPKYGVSEMLAIDAQRFLVIERDGKAGAEAAFKLITMLDLSGATDVSAIESLPSDGLPSGVVAGTKKPFLDLVDPRFGLAGDAFPEKVEGLCWGPDLSDGRRTLFVSTDNDFKPDQPTFIWVFAVDPADLARR